MDLCFAYRVLIRLHYSRANTFTKGMNFDVDNMCVIAVFFFILVMISGNASSVNLKILNICDTTRGTLSVRYSFGTTKNSSNGGRFTLGPKAHTSLSLLDATRGFVWSEIGADGQCAVR